MNYLERKAAYLETGVWAKKALKEAKGIGEAYAIASSADKNYSTYPGLRFLKMWIICT